MALGQLESNTPNILNDLHAAIGLKYIKLNFNIEVRESIDWAMVISGSPVGIHNDPPRVDLRLEVYLDQMAPEKHNIAEIEKRIAAVLEAVDGRWMQRQISPFRGEKIIKIDYQIMLADYNNFIEKLHQYALTQVDIEFREVLEETIAR